MKRSPNTPSTTNRGTSSRRVVGASMDTRGDVEFHGVFASAQATPATTRISLPQPPSTMVGRNPLALTIPFQENRGGSPIEDDIPRLTETPSLFAANNSDVAFDQSAEEALLAAGRRLTLERLFQCALLRRIADEVADDGGLGGIGVNQRDPEVRAASVALMCSIIDAVTPIDLVTMKSPSQSLQDDDKEVEEAWSTRQQADRARTNLWYAVLASCHEYILAITRRTDVSSVTAVKACKEMLDFLADPVSNDNFPDEVQQINTKRYERLDCLRNLIFAVTTFVLLSCSLLLFIFGSDLLISPLTVQVRQGVGLAAAFGSFFTVPPFLWAALWTSRRQTPSTSSPPAPSRSPLRSKAAMQQLVIAIDRFIECMKRHVGGGGHRATTGGEASATHRNDGAGAFGATPATMMPFLDDTMDLTRLWTVASQEMYIERVNLLKNAFVISMTQGGIITNMSAVAARRLGFHPDESVGQSIDMLVDESGADEIEWCIDALLNNTAGMGSYQRSTRATIQSTKPVRFTSLSQGSIQVNLMFARVFSRDGRRIGVCMIGTEEMRLESTNHVFLSRYRVAELNAELSTCAAALREGDRHVLDSVLPRVFKVSKSLGWNAISLAAHQMKNWRTVRSHSMLDTLSRSHMHVADFKFAAHLPELVECDVDGIVLVLTELLRFVSTATNGRCSIDVSTRLFDQHHALLFTVSNFIPPRDFGTLIETFVANLCATLRTDVTGQVTLMVPVRLMQAPESLSVSMTAAGRSNVFSTAGGLVSSPVVVGSGGVGGTFNFILHEPNNVSKHVVCMALWSHGHAVNNLSGPRDLDQILQQDPNNLPDCILLSSAASLSPMLARDVRSRAGANLYITVLEPAKGDMTSAAASAVVAADSAWREGLATLPLPLTRQSLDNLFRTLSGMRSERMARRRELDDKRRVLSTHRGAPWKRGRRLGIGSFAEVFEAESELTGGTMAVKVISLDRFDEKQVEQFIGEIEILCTLSHPNIVYYFYCEQTERTLNLFMELCHNNSLLTQLRSKGHMNVTEAQSALRQVLAAVEYLHEKGFVHRDIKPANILVARDGTLKLTDFGTATKTSSDLRSTAGTIRYMAPEVYNGEAHGTSCDIWSVGVLYLELIGALPPDNGLCPSFYSDNINDPVILPPIITGDAKAFLGHCLQRKEKNRPSATTLLHHPFLLRNELSSLPSKTFTPAQINTPDEDAPATGGAGGGANNGKGADMMGDVGAGIDDLAGRSAHSDSSDLLQTMPPARF